MSQKVPKRSWSQKGCHVINPKSYNFNKFQHGKCLMLSKRYESTEVEHRTWLHVLRGNSGPPAVTLTKWLKWCVHARYMKVLSVIVSTFKRRMKKKLGKRREKWGAMHYLVLVFSFWDCFTVTLGGLMLLYYVEGGGGGFWSSSPGEILVEYVQNCDILDQFGRKTLHTRHFLFLNFGYWNGIEIITNYFEN